MAKTAEQKAAAKARRLKRQGRTAEAQQVIDESYQVPRPRVEVDDPTDYRAVTSYRHVQKDCMKLMEELELLLEVRPRPNDEVRFTDLGNITTARGYIQKAISHMKDNKDVVRRVRNARSDD